MQLLKAMLLYKFMNNGVLTNRVFMIAAFAMFNRRFYKINTWSFPFMNTCNLQYRFHQFYGTYSDGYNTTNHEP